MARRRRNGGRRKRGRGRKTRNGIIRGSQHPPSSSASPWNCLTLASIWTSSNTAGIACFMIKQIRTAIRTEIGLETSQLIDLRYLRVDLWVPPSQTVTGRNNIILSPSDYSDAAICKSWSQLNWYEAWGTVAEPAHLHYVWPRSISNRVLAYEYPDDLTLFRLDVPSGDVSYIVKSHVLWRPSNPDPRPTVTGELTSVRASRRRLSTCSSLSVVDIADISLSATSD